MRSEASKLSGHFPTTAGVPRVTSRLAALPLLLSLAACAGTADTEAGKVKIDTLAGGIVRTITSAPIDSGRWTLELERTLQPAEGTPGELISPNDLALADDGTLLIAEGDLHSVRAYDTTGAMIRSFGRDGEGPGEFRSAYIAVSGDTLVVQDPRTARLTTFRVTDGTLLNGRASVCCHYGSVGIDGSGRAILRTILRPDSSHGPSSGFARASLDGKTIDTVAVTDHPRETSERKRWLVREGKMVRMEMMVPFQPADLHFADPRGGFLTAWTGEYLLRTSRNGRDTVTMFGRPRTSAPVSAAEKQGIIEARIASNKANWPEATLRASLVADAIPNERPAFDWIASDRRGRHWVRRSSADTTVVRFDLFSAEGKWLDVVSVAGNGWPRSLWTATSWTRDHVAVLLEDDASRPLVRIYRITHTEK